MSEMATTLTVMDRKRAGTGGSRDVRRDGFIPAVIYGDNQDNQNIKLDVRDIVKGMHSPAFTSTVLDLDLEGKKQKAIVRDIQLHPVTDRPIHVDFLRVSAKTEINVNVPVEFINEDECNGLKQGGVLNIVLHEVEVICPADKLPDHLTVDLKGLSIGDSVHSSTLDLPKGAKFANAERDATVATIVAPTKKEETPVEEMDDGIVRDEDVADEGGDDKKSSE